MKEVIDALSRFTIHTRCGRQGLYGRFFYGFDILEMTHQRLAAGRANVGDIVQDGMNLAFAAEAAVVFDGKAVGLILDTGDQLEAFGTLVDGNLHIVVV